MAEQSANAWTNPVDHFRPNLKFLSIYTERLYNIRGWLDFKTSALGKWYLPWWSPLYAFSTMISQRNRNLQLVENTLGYRPYKYRADTENGQY